MVAQVGKLGAEYMKWVHSPVNRPLRLFGPEIIEFFSKTPWYMVPIVWLPVVLYISTIGLTHLAVDVTSFLTNAYSIFVVFVCIFLFGTFLWTLVEYILHRYLFHITPPDDSPFWITFHFFIHGQHHKVSFKTHFLKLYLYWIFLSVLNCSS
jgi:4-hydroxysphinganine ceramide fatty acyl 2-hydroxylase